MAAGQRSAALWLLLAMLVLCWGGPVAGEAVIPVPPQVRTQLLNLTEWIMTLGVGDNDIHGACVRACACADASD
jgi:hypothetical protein